MKTLVDLRLRREAESFAFRHMCDECVYFAAAQAACTHGYPTEHRTPIAVADEISFCKEFEIE